MQAALGSGIAQAGHFIVRPLLFLGDAGQLLAGCVLGTGQLGLAGLQAALGEGGLLGLALQAAQLFAGLGQAALGVAHPVFQLGVALLGIGQLHVQLFKPGFGGDAALLQVFQLGMDFGLVGGQLLAALAGLLGLLLQPQHLHLQLVLAGLGVGGLGAGGGQVAHALGVLGLGTGQGAAGLVRNQGVGTHLLVQVLDFLRPRQQAGLLGVGGIESQAVARHGMACRGVNGLTGLQTLALGQGFFQRGCRVAALEPVGQQGAQAAVGQVQPVGQSVQPAGGGGAAA